MPRLECDCSIQVRSAFRETSVSSDQPIHSTIKRAIGRATLSTVMGRRPVHWRPFVDSRSRSFGLRGKTSTTRTTPVSRQLPLLLTKPLEIHENDERFELLLEPPPKGVPVGPVGPPLRPDSRHGRREGDPVRGRGTGGHAQGRGHARRRRSGEDDFGDLLPGRRVGSRFTSHRRSWSRRQMTVLPCLRR